MKNEILETIIQHGLSIRQVPTVIISRYEMRHFKDGDTVVEIKSSLSSLPKSYFNFLIPNENYRFNENGEVFRRYAERKRVPAHPGYWMCQKVTHTGSRVLWNIKTCNLAPTLQESVDMFLKGLTNKQ